MQKSCHAFRSMTGHGKNLFKVWGTIIVMDLNSSRLWAFLPQLLRIPPLHLPKRVELGQSCIRPRWNTCSWPGWGDFFHSSLFRSQISWAASRASIWWRSGGTGVGFLHPGQTDTEEGGSRFSVCVGPISVGAATQRGLNLRRMPSAVVCVSYGVYFLLFPLGYPECGRNIPSIWAGSRL